MPTMSLGMAAATVVGTALGAQLTKKARDASWCLGAHVLLRCLRVVVTDYE